jgi:hypothetical protein
VPSPFIACLEWQRLPNAKMRRDLHSRRRHFFNKKVSLINFFSTQTQPEEMLVDKSAAATVHELGESLTAMEVQGQFFGSCSLTLVVFDRTRAGWIGARGMRQSAGRARRLLLRGDLQPAQRVARRRPRQLGAQPATSGPPQHQCGGLEPGVHAAHRVANELTPRRPRMFRGLRDRPPDAVFLESASRGRRSRPHSGGDRGGEVGHAAANDDEARLGQELIAGAHDFHASALSVLGTASEIPRAPASASISPGPSRDVLHDGPRPAHGSIDRRGRTRASCGATSGGRHSHLPPCR